MFEYHRGESPILVSFPHDGTDFPARIKPGLNEHGLKNTDGDWYIFELYNRIIGRDISYIRARYSRYVVDLNRSPAGELLYPGKMETGICPLATFDGMPVYLPGKQPGDREVRSRVETYWQPYHNHLQAELRRIRDRHGYAILWDAHSIRAEVPGLFDGVLPDLNFGTAGGRSCAQALIEQLVGYAARASTYSVALNGRFKGGYITRHYGDPASGVHSIQLEINQNTYLTNTEEPEMNQEQARRLSLLLHSLLQSAVPAHAGIQGLN